MICWHCGENEATYWRPRNSEVSDWHCEKCAKEYDRWLEGWELRDVDIDNAFTGFIGE